MSKGLQYTPISKGSSLPPRNAPRRGAPNWISRSIRRVPTPLFNTRTSHLMYRTSQVIHRNCISTSQPLGSRSPPSISEQNTHRIPDHSGCLRRIPGNEIICAPSVGQNHRAGGRLPHIHGLPAGRRRIFQGRIYLPPQCSVGRLHHRPGLLCPQRNCSHHQ